MPSDVIIEAQPGSVIVAAVTGRLRVAPLLRLQREPTEQTGLPQPRRDHGGHAVPARTDRVGNLTGRLSDQDPVALDGLLAFVTGIA